MNCKLSLIITDDKSYGLKRAHYSKPRLKKVFFPCPEAVFLSSQNIVTLILVFHKRSTVPCFGIIPSFRWVSIQDQFENHFHVVIILGAVEVVVWCRLISRTDVGCQAIFTCHKMKTRTSREVKLHTYIHIYIRLL